MKWTIVEEILSRITGISTPIFGLSWNPQEPPRSVARRVLAHLENARVLYALTEFEYPIPCHTKINQLREMLSEEIGKIEKGSELSDYLRGILNACLNFVSDVEAKELLVKRISDYPYPAKHWEFIECLMTMRKEIGIRVAFLSVAYRVDIEDRLAKILPQSPKDK